MFLTWMFERPMTYPISRLKKLINLQNYQPTADNFKINFRTFCLWKKQQVCTELLSQIYVRYKCNISQVTKLKPKPKPCLSEIKGKHSKAELRMAQHKVPVRPSELDSVN